MHDRTRPPRQQSRYPGYDVLSKWDGPSWNEQTRRVIARRISISGEPRFFTAEEFQTLKAIADLIVPQPGWREPIAVAALVDRKLHEGIADGYRVAGMPRQAEAWRLGLRALDAEAEAAHSQRFHELSRPLRESLLRRMQHGELQRPEWGSMRAADFFKRRMGRDIVLAYYSHPTVWSEIGWGGPASPRGYVRLDFDERDPWEPAEAKTDSDVNAFRINRHVR
jgi:Gluconate 2-dehydrogenase subunit 3